MCWVGKWHLLHLVLLQGYANGVGAIPSKAAWGMLESPLDPPSRFPFRRDCPSALCAIHYADKDDSSEPPSPEGWQSFQLWWQMASNMLDGQLKHFLQMRPSL